MLRLIIAILFLLTIGIYSGISWAAVDCNGDPDGTAYVDNCMNCVGGNTGETACPDPGGLPHSIKIYPEHVGVFTSLGSQQFVIFGIKKNGFRENVTNQVNCTSSDETLVTIDANNLATVESGKTNGQVAISCTYPGAAYDTTSMTIVNIAQAFYGSSPASTDVTQWQGAWPSSSSSSMYPSGHEVYLYNAQVIAHGQSWLTRPWATPWDAFPDAGGLNSMISNVYSIDGGQTFSLFSWDYLAPTSHSKGGEGSWDDCWIGTMVHSFCDFDPGHCNGRYRSNLYFSPFAGDTGCWGSLSLPDCNGEIDGTAYFDNCGTCVSGSTGLTACSNDCNGDAGGTASIDDCGICVGGSTGLTACSIDCNEVWGGTAYIDDCGLCVGGSTGLSPCVQDCNGDEGGTAYLDGCGVCVGGWTGLLPCDCNGDQGGNAYNDQCGNCVGGLTGLAACVQDCNADWGGTAYLDGCGVCVGGWTGLTECTPAFPLAISKTGTGIGIVYSDPAGIYCGVDCTQDFQNSSSVSLTAASDADSTFAGWSGDGCNGTETTCTITMDQARNISASFSSNLRVLTVNKNGGGKGFVSSTPVGLYCDSFCNSETAPFADNTTVTLSVISSPDSVFTGWSGGGCSGTGDCIVTMTDNVTVNATFDINTGYTSNSKAIIIAGYGNHSSNWLWEETLLNANYACLRSRWISLGTERGRPTIVLRFLPVGTFTTSFQKDSVLIGSESELTRMRLPRCILSIRETLTGHPDFYPEEPNRWLILGHSPALSNPLL